MNDISTSIDALYSSNGIAEVPSSDSLHRRQKQFSLNNEGCRTVLPQSKWKNFQLKNKSYILITFLYVGPSKLTPCS